MQSKSLQDTVYLPAGKACRSMAKIGNAALLTPLNWDHEGSPEPWRAFAMTLTWEVAPSGILTECPSPLAKLRTLN